MANADAGQDVMLVGEPEGKQGAVICQGVSAWDEPCLAPATRHCEQCGSWFCEPHFLNPGWHPCAQE